MKREDTKNTQMIVGKIMIREINQRFIKIMIIGKRKVTTEKELQKN